MTSIELTSTATVPARIRMAVLGAERPANFAPWLRDNAPDFDLVLSATSWPDLVYSDSFPTELVLMDLQPHEPVSLEARVRTCRAAGAKVIVLSDVDRAATRRRALDAGAVAFVGVSRPLGEVMDAARSALASGSTDRPRQWTSRTASPAQPSRPRLSAGETEALLLYVSGLTTPQVAELMHVQYETAKTYLRRVREKYARVNRPASKRAELVSRAAEDGYPIR